jgi:hypothetical protein
VFAVYECEDDYLVLMMRVKSLSGNYSVVMAKKCKEEFQNRNLSAIDAKKWVVNNLEGD